MLPGLQFLDVTVAFRTCGNQIAGLVPVCETGDELELFVLMIGVAIFRIIIQFSFPLEFTVSQGCHGS